MNQSISQNFHMKMQDVSKKRELHILKILFIAGFIIGFVIFFFLGREFVEDTCLLDSDSLIEIRDNAIDQGEFFLYVFWRRLLIFGIGVLLWWWGFGRVYVCGVAACCSIVMGACLYISLLRYPLTGLFLWFFLYFPHIIFYAGVILCGMILSAEKCRSKEEKLKFLWQNAVLVILLMLFFILAIYCESYLNVILLQIFLEYF